MLVLRLLAVAFAAVVIRAAEDPGQYVPPVLSRVSRPAICPVIETPDPKQGCYWIPRRNPRNGCLERYEERCQQSPPSDCAPISKPPPRAGCVYVSIHDDAGCIVEFQCSPDNCPEITKPEPKPGCEWRAMLDTRGCIVAYGCSVAPDLRQSLPLIGDDDLRQSQDEVEKDVLEAGASEETAGIADEVFEIEPSKAEFDLDDRQHRPLIELVDEITPKDSLQEEYENLKNKEEIVLKDALGFFPGGLQAGPARISAAGPPIIRRIQPALPIRAPLPARPILAARPAVAIQPVAVTRPLLPRPAPIVAAPPPFRLAPLAPRPFFPPPPPFRGPPPCPFNPIKPSDSEYCTWITLKDQRGCTTGFECEPVDAAPKIDCPRAPVKPDAGEMCNWIPVQDKNNCILKYECEPIPQDLCPPEPQPPEENDRCNWVAIKDASNCILDYECIPLNPIPPPQLPPPIHSLRNQSPYCCFWAAKGECDSNPAFMQVKCAKSCANPGCSGGFAAQSCAGYLRLQGCPYLGGGFPLKRA